MANCIGTIIDKQGRNVAQFDVKDADAIKSDSVSVFKSAASALTTEQLSKLFSDFSTITVDPRYQIQQENTSEWLKKVVGESVPSDIAEYMNYPDAPSVSFTAGELRGPNGERINGAYVRGKNPGESGTIYVSALDLWSPDATTRDTAAIWNTLRHELVHAKNDAVIIQAEANGDANGVIKSIRSLYETVKLQAENKLRGADHSINTAIKAIEGNEANKRPTEIMAYLFGSLEGLTFMMNNCEDKLKAVAGLLPDLPRPKTMRLEAPVEAQVESNVQAKAMTEERRSELLNLGYDLGSQVFRGAITKEEANRRAVDATNSDEELGCVKSELDRYAVMPFETGATVVSEQDMMPQISWDNNGRKFKGANEAQAFFNARKENMQDYWGMSEDVTNEYQLYSIKSGDVVKMSLIQTFPGNASDYGLKGNEKGYLSMPMRMLASEFEANPTTDAKVLANRKELMEKIGKYTEYSKNYLVNGTFYDNEAGKWAAYILTDGVGKGEGKTFMTRVYLDLDSVESVRRLSNDFKTNYTRDDNGNLVAKEKTTAESMSAIANDPIRQAKAREVLQAINTASGDFKEQLNSSNYFIGTYNKDESQRIMGKFGNAVEMTGFYGEMGQFAKSAPNYSIIKYTKGKLRDYAVKIGNVPGGVVVMTKANEVISVSGDAITAVIADYRDGSDMRLRVEAEQEMADSSKFFVKGHSISENSNVFPFFRDNTEWEKEGKDPAKARQEMAARLKQGDLIQIAYHKDNAWQEFNAQVLYATSARVAYVTKSGHVGYVNPSTHNNLPKRKVQVGNAWVFSEDGKTPYAPTYDKAPKPEIRAAYQFNNKGRLVEYINSFKAEVDASWSNNARKLQIDDAADLDSMISQTIGFTFGEIQTEEGAIHESRESLEAQWDFEYFNDGDNGEVDKAAMFKAASTLIPGDIIITQFTNDKGETKNARHIFIGYNSHGTPMVANQRLSKGSYFTSGINSDSVVGVGRRTTPLAYLPGAGKNGRGLFVNDFASNHDGAIELSPGRPDDIAMMQDRLKYFVAGGARKAKLYDTLKEAGDVAAAMPGNNKGGRRYRAVQKQGYADVNTGDIAYFTVEPTDKTKWSKVDGDIKYGIENAYVKALNGKEITVFSRAMRNMDLDNGYLTVGTGDLKFSDIQSFVEKGQYVQITWNESGGKAKYFDAVVESSSPNKIKASFFTKDGNRIKKHPLFITANSDMKITEVNMKRHKYKDVADIRKTKPEVKKSKSFAEAKKSHDSKQAIKRIAKRLSNVYNTPINVMDTQAFNEIGAAIGQDLTGVRGLVYNGQVYINFDVASTADVLHEMTHLILPGLKATNPEVYDALIAKVQDHPMYQAVRENYAELSGQDLAEEAFCTIFGEYFRSELMSQEAMDWAGNDVIALSDDIPAILQQTLGLGYVDASGSMLMNMTLEDIMTSFGSDLIMGRFQRLNDFGATLQHSRQINTIYQQLLDSGNLIRLC